VAATAIPDIEKPKPDGPAPGAARWLLIGAPNVGKSALFGRLTGAYSVVSNYPGTSVEVVEGRAAGGQRLLDAARSCASCWPWACCRAWR
jgi:ribosome-binding ATPase YchF (GTP1/OBG family)